LCHLYGDVTIAGEGLQNLGLCSALRAFGQEARVLYDVTLATTQGLNFPGLIRRTAPFSRLTRGYGGSIIIRILVFHYQYPNYVIVYLLLYLLMIYVCCWLPELFGCCRRYWWHD
jgi:hypothetical protein